MTIGLIQKILDIIPVVEIRRILMMLSTFGSIIFIYTKMSIPTTTTTHRFVPITMMMAEPRLPIPIVRSSQLPQKKQLRQPVV